MSVHLKTKKSIPVGFLSFWVALEKQRPLYLSYGWN